MTTKRWTKRIAATVAGLTLFGSGALAAPAQADHLGTTSLATVLAADGSGFDRNAFDYDILDNAVSAVLGAKPSSPVAVLADGTVPLTAFLPTDRAFRRLARNLLGHTWRSEQRVFTELAGALGVDVIEAVLLYHVVPGATIDFKTALGADGATLDTASGGTLLVKVRGARGRFLVLGDADYSDPDAGVIQRNINRGNVQIAHGVNQVLRPLDLP